jgi:hypothetical protein
MGELGYSWGPVCLVCNDMAVLSLLALWLKTHCGSWVVLAIVEGLPFRVV